MTTPAYFPRDIREAIELVDLEATGVADRIDDLKAEYPGSEELQKRLTRRLGALEMERGELVKILNKRLAEGWC